MPAESAWPPAPRACRDRRVRAAADLALLDCRALLRARGMCLVGWHCARAGGRMSATTHPRASGPRGRPNGWWGMAVFVASEATLIGALVGTYFYLAARRTAGRRPARSAPCRARCCSPRCCSRRCPAARSASAARSGRRGRSLARARGWRRRPTRLPRLAAARIRVQSISSRPVRARTRRSTSRCSPPPTCTSRRVADQPLAACTARDAG